MGNNYWNQVGIPFSQSQNCLLDTSNTGSKSQTKAWKEFKLDHPDTNNNNNKRGHNPDSPMNHEGTN